MVFLFQKFCRFCHPTGPDQACVSANYVNINLHLTRQGGIKQYFSTLLQTVMPGNTMQEAFQRLMVLKTPCISSQYCRDNSLSDAYDHQIWPITTGPSVL